MNTPAEAGLLRSLAFFDAMDYAPTFVEWVSGWDKGRAESETGEISEISVGANGLFAHAEASATDIAEAAGALVEAGTVQTSHGRFFLPGREALIALHEDREALFPRKLRRARRVARWLSRIGGVRFVALCNTTALAHARDESDLDFFVVTADGVLSQVRGWAALPFKFLGLRPGREPRDAVCLSFFIDEAAQDLSHLSLPEDDPYLRSWFLSLLPLYDDGIGKGLWQANAPLRARHPFAAPWGVHPGMAIRQPFLRIPTLPSLDPLSRRLQSRTFPSAIAERMNRDTSVVINHHVLKFHVDDARASFRDRYAERCHRLALTP